ncbi:hypothetical protein ACIBG8_22085 [Nonomuraea sp. NPDC050556]|uniref:protein kinase domain-containing protein n=1 Tax=Nonomuraea sp. NPDC050556 TaxID=3364369 RepID=UPI0037B06972
MRLAGRYRLLNALGEGSVRLAFDESLHRDVAVKELRYPASPADLRAAALVRHPSLVTVHEVLVEEGRTWLVMEFVSGASLERSVHARHPLPVPQAARIGAHLLGALTAGHVAGFVHGRVNPGNVMLTTSGRAVLTGLCGPRPSLPASSDLWSLAATLHFALEGRPPGDSPAGGDDPLRALIRDLLQPYGPPEVEVVAQMLDDIASNRRRPGRHAAPPPTAPPTPTPAIPPTLTPPTPTPAETPTATPVSVPPSIPATPPVASAPTEESEPTAPPASTPTPMPPEPPVVAPPVEEAPLPAPVVAEQHQTPEPYPTPEPYFTPGAYPTPEPYPTPDPYATPDPYPTPEPAGQRAPMLVSAGAGLRRALRRKRDADAPVRTLDQMISTTGPLPPERVAAIGLAVLDQLTAVHERGEYHADIRPGTILVGDGGGATLDVPLMPSGISAYTAPEGGTGPAADLWSLGATLYTAVEGTPPSPGAPLTRAGALAPVLFALLAGDPSQRPSVASLRHQLKAVIS